MGDIPACAAELFEHYARGGQHERSSVSRPGRPGNAASLALTQSQWMLLCRELGLMERGGPAGTSGAATPALLQGAFAAHALPGSVSVPLPRMPFKEYVVALQAVAAQCGVPDVWHVVEVSPVLPSVQAAGGMPLRAPNSGVLPLRPAASGAEALTDDQLAALAAIPALLARVAALEAAASTAPPAPSLNGLDALLERLAEHDTRLDTLHGELTTLRAQPSLSMLPAGTASDELVGTVGSPSPPAPRPPPLPRTSLTGGPQPTPGAAMRRGPAGSGEASDGTAQAVAEDVKAINERLRVMASQQSSLSTMTMGLSSEMKRVTADMLEVRRTMEGGTRAARPSASESRASDMGDPEIGRTLQDMYRMRDSITLSHERARVEFSKRLEAVETLVERLSRAGIMPPPETATKAELADMQVELTSKVDDLQSRMEETLKALEARFGSDIGAGGPEGPERRASPPPGAGMEEDVTEDRRSPAKAVPEPRARHTWDAGAKPTGGLLKQESVVGGGGDGGGGAGDGDNGAAGDVASSTALRLALERKRVQWSAEALARAEAIEVRRRMADIKSKVQSGGMGSWDMSRVKNQLNKLSQRVASLERLQRMMDQMNAIGECLEILDKRQKEHKKRIEVLEARARVDPATEVLAVRGDVASLATSAHLQEGLLQHLRERVTSLEGTMLGLGEVDRRLGDTRDEVDKLRRQQATPQQVFFGPQMRLSSSFRSSTPPVAAPPGESLNLDNPKVRLASRAQRMSFTGDGSLHGTTSEGGYQLGSPGLGGTGSMSGVLSSLPVALMVGMGSMDGGVSGGGGGGSGFNSGAVSPGGMLGRRSSLTGAVAGSGSPSAASAATASTSSRLGLAPFGTASGGLGGSVFEALAVARDRPSGGHRGERAMTARGAGSVGVSSPQHTSSQDAGRK